MMRKTLHNRAATVFPRILGVAITALFAVSGNAQITFDAVGSVSVLGSTSVSWSHTVGSGANRILVVGLASEGNGFAPSASSVTYGGQSLTRQALRTLGSGISEIWTLVAPPTGTATIIVTYSQAETVNGGSVSFFGVDQGAPVRGSSTANQLNSGVISTGVFSITGDVVVDTVAVNGGFNSVTPGAGQTMRWSSFINPTHLGAGSTKPGADGTTTMSWNVALLAPGSAFATLAAISLAPAQADLSIAKTGPASVTPGSNVTYTITVTNNGPSQATGVAVSDPTPANLTFVSNSGACTTAFPCSLGTLNNGQSVTITATFSVPASFRGSFSNTATVSSTTTDPSLLNNSATASSALPDTPLPPTLLLVCLGLSTVSFWRWRNLREGESHP